MIKLIIIALCISLSLADAKSRISKRSLSDTSLLDISKLDLENIDCNSKVDLIDECGLQQGVSHRYEELVPAGNFSALQESCRRQHEALKCLKANAKCLPALSKQVLLALVNSRAKYNKKICADKQSETANKLLAYNNCVRSKPDVVQRAIAAEINSIVTPEAISRTKFSTVQERIKYSCCSVAKARKVYMDASLPECKEHQGAAAEMIDSYLSDTIGIICPDFESKAQSCDRLSNLELGKPVSKSFIKPIINVVQTLSNM